MDWYQKLKKALVVRFPVIIDSQLLPKIFYVSVLTVFVLIFHSLVPAFIYRQYPIFLLVFSLLLFCVTLAFFFYWLFSFFKHTSLILSVQYYVSKSFIFFLLTIFLILPNLVSWGFCAWKYEELFLPEILIQEISLLNSYIEVSSTDQDEPFSTSEKFYRRGYFDASLFGDDSTAWILGPDELDSLQMIYDDPSQQEEINSLLDSIALKYGVSVQDFRRKDLKLEKKLSSTNDLYNTLFIVGLLTIIIPFFFSVFGLPYIYIQSYYLIGLSWVLLLVIFYGFFNTFVFGRNLLADLDATLFWEASLFIFCLYGCIIWVIRKMYPDAASPKWKQLVLVAHISLLLFIGSFCFQLIFQLGLWWIFPLWYLMNIVVSVFMIPWYRYILLAPERQKHSIWKDQTLRLRLWLRSWFRLNRISVNYPILYHINISFILGILLFSPLMYMYWLFFYFIAEPAALYDFDTPEHAPSLNSYFLIFCIALLFFHRWGPEFVQSLLFETLSFGNSWKTLLGIFVTFWIIMFSFSPGLLAHRSYMILSGQSETIEEDFRTFQLVERFNQHKLSSHLDWLETESGLEPQLPSTLNACVQAKDAYFELFQEYGIAYDSAFQQTQWDEPTLQYFLNNSLIEERKELAKTLGRHTIIGLSSGIIPGIPLSLWRIMVWLVATLSIGTIFFMGHRVPNKNLHYLYTIPVLLVILSSYNMIPFLPGLPGFWLPFMIVALFASFLYFLYTGDKKKTILFGWLATISIVLSGLAWATVHYIDEVNLLIGFGLSFITCSLYLMIFFFMERHIYSRPFRTT